MSELSLLIWDIFYVREIWSDSSVQKIQKVQHASSAAAEKSCQNSYHVSISAESLTEFKATVKWACENNTW